jgi:hypothetical protein
MKKTICILLFLTSFTSVFSQEPAITATYEEVKNKAVKGLLDTYISKSGEKFSVGDTITLGPSFTGENYSFIFQRGLETMPLPNIAVGKTVVITQIKAYFKTASFITTSPEGYVFGLRGILEEALDKGEIKSKTLSSDEALAALKKAKDKLDLGLITEEQFNNTRNELAPLID